MADLPAKHSTAAFYRSKVETHDWCLHSAIRTQTRQCRLEVSLGHVVPHRVVGVGCNDVTRGVEECRLPASGQKYLYERLNPQDFQLLVNAVMPHAFSAYRPLPLGQPDGGRDGLAIVDGKTLVFQVKWSASGREKDSVSWLSGVVRDEEKNLRRLAKEGVRRYVLVTNVPSTGKPGAGTFDRLNEKFEEYAKEFGFESMTCVWREGMDGFLDSTADEVKWAYADMLAGWDLVRYLVGEHFGASRDRGLREMVRKVATTQWADDELVKFSQVDVDRERVADLFIDITSQRLEEEPFFDSRGNIARPALHHSDLHIGGAAAYLLKGRAQATLVRGAPGQGKSTLSQYVSQAHRAAFIPADVSTVDLPTPVTPRFPLRADLSEYARWLQGIDVFDPAERDASRENAADLGEVPRSMRPKTRPASRSTLECFLSELMTYTSGGSLVNADDVHELFKRLPSIVVLDGLDEVGSPKMREKVVDAINRFTHRARTYPVPVQVVVTTRPSNNSLPEPVSELFEVIVLNELTHGQRDDYLRKWCAVRDIRGKEGRDLRKSFKEKSEEPYIGDLAGNPMQLTILLDLIHERGAATPTQRTELYDHYVDLLLAREANKHPISVRKHRENLKEVMPFLGWYLQSRSEEKDLPGRMRVDELKEAMRHFQRCYGKPEDAVDEMFEAASDRLWTLTSKAEGSYEFEVLSLREYFAARFLYRWAGEGQRGFDRTIVLRELLRRPLWLNTARFYGGNAEGGDVVLLADAIVDEVRGRCTAQARAAAWTLVTDGVFQGRPRRAREVIDALLGDDDGIAALLDALSRNEVHPLPGLPVLPAGDGPDTAWTRLTAAISAAPDDPGARRWVRATRELLNQRSAFTTWWSAHMSAAAGTSTQRPWLEIAANCEAAAGLEVDFDRLDLEGDIHPERHPVRPAGLILDTGLVPSRGGALEARLLAAVLDGECPEVTSIRSMPAQVAVALRPAAYITSSETGFSETAEPSPRRRSDAIARLRRTAPSFAKVASYRRFKQGQKGSTFPWSDTAAALYDIAGRCWLASELAIIGAASPHRLGVTRKPEMTAFGADGHPAELLAQTRAHATDVTWWREQLAVVTDPTVDNDLLPAEWALALWSIPSPDVVSQLLSEWESVLVNLSERRRLVVLRAARTIALGGLLIHRPVEGTASDESLQPLLAARTPSATSARHDRPKRRESVSRPGPPPLAEVSRAGEWFKVDVAPAYR